ncbi:hypothetical protein SAMN05421847_2141 [Halpernia humi]|uniref:YD repeat-containing protein n=1 Tax=Halpernia humi TaxID=493375 RepID=A0A1H5ZPX9_9FLAO|nr:RHS repeat domain-containing protein [Halpernia humi]SEG38469.1 hypothetical protein SAMN05421847_2141 [Halpernia humi]
MRNKHFLSLTTTIFGLFTIFGQTTSYTYDKISQITSPPSQEAYNLGTYGEVPLGLSTGAPNVSIPLSGISSNGVSVQYSASYSSNGLQVDELGGALGLGWQLIGGGVITRTVKDLPDEETTTSHFPEMNIKAELDQGNVNAFQYLQDITDSGVDSEPDIYNFSFNGRSGKFIFDNNKNIHEFSQTNLKIERLDEPGIGVCFKITDEQGNIYLFKDVETSLFLKSTGGSTPSTNTSAWYLSEIIPTAGKPINFTYENNDYEYTASISQNLNLPYDLLLIHGFTSGISNYPPNPYLSEPFENRLYIHGKAISEITIPDGISLKFTYDTIANSPKRLKSIVKKQGNSILDNYSTEYLTTANNRTFLTKINNTTKNQNYTFSYINPEAFPLRLSNSQDLYGYFNGVSNSNLIPRSVALLYPTTGLLINSLADRSSDVNFNKIGLLNKIIYPTKGYSLLEYEGNNENTSAVISSINYDPQHILYWDEDLDAITDSEGVQTIINGPFSKTFSSDIVFNLYNKSSLSSCGGGFPDHYRTKVRITKEDGTYNQVIVLPDNDSPIKVNLSAGNYTFSLEPSPGLFCVNTSVAFGYLVPDKFNIQYSTTQTKTGSVGSRLLSSKKYDFGGALLGEQYYYYEGFNYLYPLDFISYKAELMGPDGYGYGFKFVGTSMNINSGEQKILINPQNSFVFDKVSISEGGANYQKGGEVHYFRQQADHPNSIISGFQANDYKIYSYDSDLNGQESKTEIIDQNKSVLKRIEYDYSERSTLEKPFYSIVAHDYYARLTGGLDPTHMVVNGVGSYDPLYNVEVMQYNINSFNKFLQRETTTDYLNGSPLITTTEYFYNNLAHYQQTSQKRTFPDGTILQSDYQYAQEKGNQYLIGKNMVGIPLQTTVTKNNVGVSSVETKYPISQTEASTKTNGLPLPMSAISYSLQIPGSSSTPTTEVTYDQYDAKGNLLQYTTKAGIPVAIIWGYNQTQPIAKIEGATYAQVSSLATQLITASDLDAADPTKESDLISALDNFRKNSAMANYQISTYTYDPLIGVTSITPPSGIREIYKYDAANRLQSVKDVNGNILKEYKYNYKP